MKLDDDQKLIKRVVNGEKKAFEELMRKYNKKIYNYILKMIREEEIAVELTQEFFMKIYRLLYTYNFVYKFSTWAYRICYNLVIDHIRKNKIYIASLEKDISVKGMVETENYVKEDGLDALEKEEKKKYIWKSLNCVSEKYRELILLRYINDLKYNEIAEITNLPIGTVKNRIFKAKKLLKMEIEKNGMLN
jgi:RNA polymerase sigma-70 factor (ECF subfamily)